MQTALHTYSLLCSNASWIIFRLIYITALPIFQMLSVHLQGYQAVNVCVYFANVSFRGDSEIQEKSSDGLKC